MKTFAEKMAASGGRNGSRLVLALDVSGPFEKRLGRAEEILDQTGRFVAAVKVNYHLILPFGLRGLGAIINQCRSRGLPLIADLKLNDIESTNMSAFESLVGHGFDAVIANPFVGYEEGLGWLIERAHSEGFGVLLLAYMSHKGAGEGYALRTGDGEPLYMEFARRAKAWGADGVIVSAKEREKITEVRSIVGKESFIFSPGVGAQGGKASEAVSSGVDYVIVGRTVTESREPADAIRELMGRP